MPPLHDVTSYVRSKCIRRRRQSGASRLAASSSIHRVISASIQALAAPTLTGRANLPALMSSLVWSPEGLLKWSPRELLKATLVRRALAHAVRDGACQLFAGPAAA